MAEKSKPEPLKGEEALALHIAERSDLSVNQAKDLLRKYGTDLRKIEEVVKTYKAES